MIAIISVLFSPIIALLIAIAMGRDQDALDKAAMKAGKKIRCKWCAETLPVFAAVCRHCRNDPRD